MASQLKSKSTKKRVVKRSAAKKSTTKRVVKRSVAKKSTGRARKANPALAKWRKALKSMGYLQKGSFKALPKRGTAAHKAILAKMKKM